MGGREMNGLVFLVCTRREKKERNLKGKESESMLLGAPGVRVERWWKNEMEAPLHLSLPSRATTRQGAKRKAYVPPSDCIIIITT